MRRRRWLTLLAAAMLILVTARLGLWQLDRGRQKLALQDTLQQRQALPAMDAPMLAATAQEASKQYYRRVVLRGQWIPNATVALENRQMAGRVGFHVITPLLLSDSRVVVVQRGWMPRDFQDRTKLALPRLPQGEVQVIGRIAPAPARLHEFAGAASGVLRQNLDLNDYAREVGVVLLPITVQQMPDPPLAGDGLLRDWPAPALDVQKHHGYAFQWFSLSALTALLVLWFHVVAPRLRKRLP